MMIQGWVDAAHELKAKSQQKTGVVYLFEFGNSNRAPQTSHNSTWSSAVVTVTSQVDRQMLWKLVRSSLCDESLSHAIRRPGTLSATWQNWLRIDIVF